MRILFSNPVGHSSEKETIAGAIGSGAGSFQNVLRSKIMDSLGGPAIRTSEPIKGMKLFGKASEQSLSDRERMIMQAKGQQAINWLARRFGIPEGFMNLILQQLGIDAEDLANPETKDIALKAIMEYFDISADEQKSLMEDFNFFIYIAYCYLP